MKHTLLSILLIGAGIVSAQSITADDTITIGDSRAYFNLDSSALSLSAVTGTSAAYDYSDIGGYMGATSNTNNVVAASGTTWASDFPGTMLCEEFENGVQTYFNNSPTDVVVDGFVYNDGSGTFIITYDVDQLIAMQFPMAVGTMYTDPIDGTAAIPGVGSVDVDGTADVNCDGHGTLTIGSNVYSNVLRIHTFEQSDGVFALQDIIITRESYVYYDLDDTNPMPIFRRDSVSAYLDAGGTFGFSAVSSKDNITGAYASFENNYNETELNVYPNPTSDVMNIAIEANVSQVAIVNSIGEVALTVNNPAANSTIDVSELIPGIYFVKIESNVGTRTKKIVVR